MHMYHRLCVRIRTSYVCTYFVQEVALVVICELSVVYSMSTDRVHTIDGLGWPEITE